MWFNVIKGTYPSLQQVDKTLPVDGTPGGTIERGMAIYQTASNTWKVVDTSTMKNVIYFALQPVTDLHALMAGPVDVPATTNYGGIPTNPAISGLCCQPTVEIETDMYTGTPDEGNLLTVNQAGTGTAGKLGLAATADTAWAICTRAAYSRWVNNKVAAVGWRTGAPANVIRAVTCFIPNIP